MKKKLIISFLLLSSNLFGFEVFDPESRIIPKQQLYNKPVQQIYFYRYFIEARYGKKFSDTKIQKEFERQKWYKINPEYSDNILNCRIIPVLSMAEKPRKR